MNTPAPKTRREQEFEAFKKAWEEYPSQDNEGFVPDRGGFKCGWFAALQWIDSTPAPSEVGDEEWIDSRVMELMGDGYNTESQGVERAVRKVMLREGIAHARRTQAEFEFKHPCPVCGKEKETSRDHAAMYLCCNTLLSDEVEKLRALLERSNEFVREYHIRAMEKGNSKEQRQAADYFSDYEKLMGKKGKRDENRKRD